MNKDNASSPMPQTDSLFAFVKLSGVNEALNTLGADDILTTTIDLSAFADFFAHQAPTQLLKTGDFESFAHLSGIKYHFFEDQAQTALTSELPTLQHPLIIRATGSGAEQQLPVTISGWQELKTHLQILAVDSDAIELPFNLSDQFLKQYAEPIQFIDHRHCQRLLELSLAPSDGTKAYLCVELVGFQSAFAALYPAVNPQYGVTQHTRAPEEVVSLKAGAAATTFDAEPFDLFTEASTPIGQEAESSTTTETPLGRVVDVYGHVHSIEPGSPRLQVGDTLQRDQKLKTTSPQASLLFINPQGYHRLSLQPNQTVPLTTDTLETAAVNPLQAGEDSLFVFLKLSGLAELAPAANAEQCFAVFEANDVDAFLAGGLDTLTLEPDSEQPFDRLQQRLLPTTQAAKLDHRSAPKALTLHIEELAEHYHPQLQSPNAKALRLAATLSDVDHILLALAQNPLGAAAYEVPSNLPAQYPRASVFAEKPLVLNLISDWQGQTFNLQPTPYTQAQAGDVYILTELVGFKRLLKAHYPMVQVPFGNKQWATALPLAAASDQAFPDAPAAAEAPSILNTDMLSEIENTAVGSLFDDEPMNHTRAAAPAINAEEQSLADLLSRQSTQTTPWHQQNSTAHSPPSATPSVADPLEALLMGTGSSTAENSNPAFESLLERATEHQHFNPQADILSSLGIENPPFQTESTDTMTDFTAAAPNAAPTAFSTAMGDADTDGVIPTQKADILELLNQGMHPVVPQTEGKSAADRQAEQFFQAPPKSSSAETPPPSNPKYDIFSDAEHILAREESTTQRYDEADDTNMSGFAIAAGTVTGAGAAAVGVSTLTDSDLFLNGAVDVDPVAESVEAVFDYDIAEPTVASDVLPKEASIPADVFEADAQMPAVDIESTDGAVFDLPEIEPEMNGALEVSDQLADAAGSPFETDLGAASLPEVDANFSADPFANANEAATAPSPAPPTLESVPASGEALEKAGSTVVDTPAETAIPTTSTLPGEQTDALVSDMMTATTSPDAPIAEAGKDTALGFATSGVGLVGTGISSYSLASTALNAMDDSSASIEEDTGNTLFNDASAEPDPEPAPELFSDPAAASKTLNPAQPSSIENDHPSDLFAGQDSTEMVRPSEDLFAESATEDAMISPHSAEVTEPSSHEPPIATQSSATEPEAPASKSAFSAHSLSPAEAAKVQTVVDDTSPLNPSAITENDSAAIVTPESVIPDAAQTAAAMTPPEAEDTVLQENRARVLAETERSSNRMATESTAGSVTSNSEAMNASILEDSGVASTPENSRQTLQQKLASVENQFHELQSEVNDYKTQVDALQSLASNPSSLVSPVTDITLNGVNQALPRSPEAFAAFDANLSSAIDSARNSIQSLSPPLQTIANPMTEAATLVQTNLQNHVAQFGFTPTANVPDPSQLMQSSLNAIMAVSAISLVATGAMVAADLYQAQAQQSTAIQTIGESSQSPDLSEAQRQSNNASEAVNASNAESDEESSVEAIADARSSSEDAEEGSITPVAAASGASGGSAQVAQGAQLWCSMGTAPAPLNTLPNGVQTGGKSLNVITDSAPMLNLPSFGMCNFTQPPKPCVPSCSPWIPTKTGTMVNGKPALDKNATTKCSNLGTIKVISPGQNGMSHA